MPYTANYPATVAEVLDDHLTFNPAALRAVRQLRASKPWRGSTEERKLKLLTCLRSLEQAYAMDRVHLRCRGGADDCYRPASRTIELNARHLSVVTFLHEFAHARGFDERQACRWSINLFRRVFPRSYARCQHVRHTLRRSV